MTAIAGWRLVLVVLAATASLLALTGSSADTADCGTWWIDQRPLEVGALMPNFGFTTCSNAEQSIADLRGKPAIINFWATWCAPCRKELPNLASAAEASGDSVQFLGVVLDQDLEQARKYMQRKPLPYAVTHDSDGIAADLNIDAVPFTVAVDAQGMVVATHRGYLDLASLEELLREAGASSGSDTSIEETMR